jgi:hypothetical protein
MATTFFNFRERGLGCVWRNAPLTATVTPVVSVLPRIDEEGNDSLFAKSFGGFQPVQTLNKYEARAVRPDQDRRLQTLVENARRDFVYSLLFEGRTSLGRNANVSDWDRLALHHDRTKG